MIAHLDGPEWVRERHVIASKEWMANKSSSKKKDRRRDHETNTEGSLFDRSNAIWGVAIKVLAAIFLVFLFYNFTLGPGRNLYGSAGAGFSLNTIWFTIINFRPPRWLGLILWFLIIAGWGTCHKILKRMDKDPSFKGT